MVFNPQHCDLVFFDSGKESIYSARYEHGTLSPVWEAGPEEEKDVLSIFSDVSRAEIEELIQLLDAHSKAVMGKSMRGTRQQMEQVLALTRESWEKQKRKRAS